MKKSLFFMLFLGLASNVFAGYEVKLKKIRSNSFEWSSGKSAEGAAIKLARHLKSRYESFPVSGKIAVFIDERFCTEKSAKELLQGIRDFKISQGYIEAPESAQNKNELSYLNNLITDDKFFECDLPWTETDTTYDNFDEIDP